MSDVFLSYAREDQAIAKRLASALEGEGLSVWWDREIRAGRRWDDVIDAELEQAGCVVVIWSPSSVASDNVKDEARDAMERGCLVPVVVAGVRLPFSFRRLQHVDLKSWKGDPSDSAFQDLLEAITETLPERPDGAQREKTTSPQGTRSREREPTPKSAYTPRRDRILPGIGTETVRLGLSSAEITRRIGTPPSQKQLTQYSVRWDYYPLGLQLVFQNDVLDSVTFIGRRPNFEPYLGTTNEGIGVTSTESEILAAYGNPGSARNARRGELTYDGIEFSLAPVGREVVEITIRKS